MDALEELTSPCGDMENWFRDVGRTVLLEALEDTCDRVNNRFRTDFEAYTESKLRNITTELETLRQKASRVSRLEDENVKLKDEIKALKEASHERTHAPGTTSHREAKSALRTPLAPRSVNQLSSKRLNKSGIEGLTHSELKAELLRIDKQHAKLHDKYFDLHDALIKSNDLVRERTAKYQDWVDHAKKLGEQSLKRAQRIKKLEAKLAEISQEPFNSSFSSDGGDVEMALQSAIPAPMATPTLAEVPRYQSRAPTPTQARVNSAARSKSPLMIRTPAESRRSDLTLGADDLQRIDEVASCLPPLPQIRESMGIREHIKSEPSSDTPVVVSERCVRKRKDVGGDEGNIPASRRIKIENSSELESTDGSRRSTPNESIDFDAEFRRVETPKKHTRYQHAHSLQLDGVVVDAQGYGHKTRIMHPLNPVKDDSRNSTSDVATTDLAAGNCPEFQDDASSALQPLNHNQVLHATSLAPGSRNRKFSTPRGLASLAEDAYPTEKATVSNRKNGPGPGVLEQLLDTPSRAQVNGASQNESSAEDGQSSDLDFRLPKRRKLPFGKDGRKRVGSAPKNSSDVPNHEPVLQSINQNYNKETIMNRTEKEKTGVPLRQMPKARLRLDDFKINPHVNEGYDYAFTDVVRKKDDRTCLQGCIKENCCGHKFRVLAHASRASTRPHEFQCLLKSYLGDDCHRLSTMSDAEKEALWVEAKTRELANASGKHRHRYPRMSTPPGFWRADFPSTQEGEEYNEEAAKLELEIIEERYREAMRPGGLWVFRDE
ncbi:DNA repair protein endonuclease SAE2/CtIP C-terminus-domain-containing protein [Xylaria sp. FL1777]|nr:DNA repair protein endonuclease SAE2/CtIP C-terminus-domain-containing protein [Xylaria sp. FL1777]